MGGAPADFFIDGRMGWDGRSTFFFCPYLENYYIFFLNFFSSLKYMFLHILLNIRRKKIGIFFFSKYFAKIIDYFFSKIFSRISQFLEKYSIYFSHCFWTLRRVIKTSFEKKIKKKIEFNFCQKISQVFFSMK